MKRIKITAVGEVKKNDVFYPIIKDYANRMSHYSKLDIFEIKDFHFNDDLLSLKKMGEKMSQRIEEQDYIICFDLYGKSLNSLQLSSCISEYYGKNTLHFFIGGSLGLPSIILDKAHKKIKLADVTLPHKLFRVIALEQIYRSFTIINKENYHK